MTFRGTDVADDVSTHAIQDGINEMYRPQIFSSSRSAVLLGFALLGATLTGCVSPEARLAKDSGTCASFGGSYGSPEYSQCMLAQQERRDNQGLRAAEQARLSTEIARNSMEITRQVRCDKEARRARKAGERPRPCR